MTDKYWRVLSEFSYLLQFGRQYMIAAEITANLRNKRSADLYKGLGTPGFRGR